MADYTFYSGILRFVAAKSDRINSDVDAMMTELRLIADQIDNGAQFTVEAAKLKMTARAFAGVGGFLQQRILPEALAEENEAAVTQIRWAVDTSMALTTALLRHLETSPTEGSFTLGLPASP